MSNSDKMSYLQNVSIYIGDDPDNYENNQLCDGSPFLKIDDENNYSVDLDTNNSGNEKPWNYAVEAWCNLEG